MKEYFLKSERIGFSRWKMEDLSNAKLLWASKEVTRYICASGVFSEVEIVNRLELEINNFTKYHVQYFPIYELSSGDLIGCCGLRPAGQDVYELGFHLRKKYWHQGIGYEAGKAMSSYGFNVLKAKEIIAGHHPNNIASKKVLLKLGFEYIGDSYYKPTGLMHPSYLLNKKKWGNGDEESFIND